MKKITKPLVIFALFLIVGLGVSFVMTQGASQQNLIKAEGNSENSIHMVSLLEDKAEPNVVLVKVGEYVQFNSKDGKTHHISSGAGEGTTSEYEHNDEESELSEHDHSGQGLESGVFGPDEGYRVHFKKPGTFEFHDHNNPNLNITVVVYTPDESI